MMEYKSLLSEKVSDESCDSNEAVDHVKHHFHREESNNAGHKLPFTNLESDRHDGNATEDDVYTVEEAVNRLGFGMFQVAATFFSGMTYLADGIEVVLLSVLLPVVACQWSLESWEEAFIASVVFIGFFFGGFTWGVIADVIGRKKTLFIVNVLVFAFGLASAFSPSYYWLLFLSGMAGFAIGGSAQAVTYYVEFLPSKTRGISVILLEMWLAIGTVLAALLAMAIMPNIHDYLNWRVYLGICTIPQLFVLLLFLTVPESARYYISRGKTEKATKVIKYIAWMNRKTPPKGRLVTQEEKERMIDKGDIDSTNESSLMGSEKPPLLKDRGKAISNAETILCGEKKTKRACKEALISISQDLAMMFKEGMWRTSVLMLFIWLGCGMIYYGSVLLTTTVLESEDSSRCGRQNGSHNVTGCQELNMSFYTKVLWTSAAEFPGILITLLLIELIGRKITMAVEFLGYATFVGLVLLCIPNVYLTIFLFGARASAAGVLQVVYVYTPEVYPTRIRGMSMGVMTSAARIGALVTPFIAQALFPVSEYATIGVYSGASLVLAVFCLLLPIETKGRTLKDISSR